MRHFAATAHYLIGCVTAALNPGKAPPMHCTLSVRPIINTSPTLQHTLCTISIHPINSYSYINPSSQPFLSPPSHPSSPPSPPRSPHPLHSPPPTPLSNRHGSSWGWLHQPQPSQHWQGGGFRLVPRRLGQSPVGHPPIRTSARARARASGARGSSPQSTAVDFDVDFRRSSVASKKKGM